MPVIIYVLAIVDILPGDPSVRLGLKFENAPPPVSPAVEMILPGQSRPFKIQRVIQHGQTGDITVLLEKMTAGVTMDRFKEPYLAAGWQELKPASEVSESRAVEDCYMDGNLMLFYPGR